MMLVAFYRFVIDFRSEVSELVFDQIRTCTKTAETFQRISFSFIDSDTRLFLKQSPAAVSTFLE